METCESGQARDWLLKRNCSLAPHQLGLAYAVLCLLSIVVAAPFVLLHGAWQVLAFTLLEMVAVAIAFLHYARHASDREHVLLTDGGLLVERELGLQRETVRLDSRRARVVGSGKGQNLVQLEADGIKVQVGRFVNEAKRRRFAEELRAALRQVPLTAPSARDR